MEQMRICRVGRNGLMRIPTRFREALGVSEEGGRVVVEKTGEDELRLSPVMGDSWNFLKELDRERQRRKGRKDKVIDAEDFVRERLHQFMTGRIPVERIQGAYEIWSARKKKGRISDIHLGRIIKRVFPLTKSGQGKGLDRKKVRFYVNLALDDEGLIDETGLLTASESERHKENKGLEIGTMEEEQEKVRNENLDSLLEVDEEIVAALTKEGDQDGKTGKASGPS